MPEPIENVPDYSLVYLFEDMIVARQGGFVAYAGTMPYSYEQIRHELFNRLDDRRQLIDQIQRS